jgi:quinol monooxygenase YgiN
MNMPYVRVAEIGIDPAQGDRYRAALAEEIEASVRLEPGVLALQAVSDRDDPSRIIVFEIYADEAAYKAHPETPHFRAYKAAVESIVTSLRLTETVPIAIGTQAT